MQHQNTVRLSAFVAVQLKKPDAGITGPSGAMPGIGTGLILSTMMLALLPV